VSLERWPILVLELADQGETSQRIGAFHAATGQVGILAKGARRSDKGSSKLRGLSVFASGNLHVVKPRDADGMAMAREWELTTSRSSLALDLDAYAMAGLVTNVLRGLSVMGHEAAQLLDLAEHHLDAIVGWIAKRDHYNEPWLPLLDLTGAWLCDVLNHTGHRPAWSHCVLSDRPLRPMEASVFHLAMGGRMSMESAAALKEGRPGVMSVDSPMSGAILQILGAWIEPEHRSEAPMPSRREDWERALHLVVRFLLHHTDAALPAYKFVRQRLRGSGADDEGA